ncbi:uncharacterized protein EI90DRAFT_2087257 [Cantharellus anzutake]|uniref:uncharacterized protein n=1 Tax=Cantharellus anzutake TaxID=1750568 RepID=UPI001904332B|nr:uncharacterized protein EI90DRAFT_2087257 [Cantharellus anzutake]KAF8340604.1 hypothetical protein EI90DRAFT_2087257 [Cantharellus anzutake]
MFNRCPEHTTCAQRAKWPCGHHTCLKCAQKMIAWEAACPQCRQPHEGKYYLLTSEILKRMARTGELPDLTLHPTYGKSVPFTPGSRSRSISLGSSLRTSPQTGGVNTPERSALSSQRQGAAGSVSSASPLTHIRSSAGLQLVHSSAATFEIEQLKLHLEASEKLKDSLSKRVKTLETEKTQLLRARDDAVREKGALQRKDIQALEDRLDAAEREKIELVKSRDLSVMEAREALEKQKAAEDRRVEDELRFIRQLGEERKKNKRFALELNDAEDRVERFRQTVETLKIKASPLFWDKEKIINTE